MSRSFGQDRATPHWDASGGSDAAVAKILELVEVLRQDTI